MNRWISLAGILVLLAGLLLPAQHTQAAFPRQSLETVSISPPGALAEWRRRRAGRSPSPACSGDHRGYAPAAHRAHPEDGQTGAPACSPRRKTNDGYIQGIYPAFLVQRRPVPGHGRLAGGARDATVTCRLDDITPAGSHKIFWAGRKNTKGACTTPVWI